MPQRIDPYKGYRFLVEIDGIQQAALPMQRIGLRD